MHCLELSSARSAYSPGDIHCLSAPSGHRPCTITVRDDDYLVDNFILSEHWRRPLF